MSRAALAVVPMLVVAVVALGLRVGAGEGVRAAVVFGAPRTGDAFAWQLATFRDWGSARETIAARVRVTAKAGARTLALEAETNDDGVAELSIPGPDAPAELEVRADDGELLAWGAPRLEEPSWRNDDGLAFARATKQTGPLVLHVAPWGGRLVAGFPGTLTVKVEGAPAPEIELEAIGEEGLSIERPPGRACPSGATTLDVLPLLQVAGLTLRARAKGGATGEWFGALPVALGAMHLGSGDVTDRTTVTAPGAARRAYVELCDDRGRARAWVLSLAPDAAEPRPHAALDLAGVPAGSYWLAISPDPRGAEKLSSSTIARRLHVGPAPLDRCEAAEKLALAARGFPRWVALDGLAGRRAVLAKRRARGRLVALAGVGSGGLLELLLVLRAARAAKRGLVALESVAPAAARRRFGALEGAIALAVAALGFAMLAAVVAWLG